MEVPKQMIVERIRSRGDFDLTEQAERELPEKVDPDQDRELLSRYGVDAAELVEQLGDQSPAAT